MKIHQSLIRDLNLQPHPEGGHYTRDFESKTQVLTQNGMRAASSRISYLLSGDESSCFHRLNLADETWHYREGNCGITIHEINSNAIYSSHILDINNPIHTVESKTWFAASLDKSQFLEKATTDPYALCSCTVAPGFDFRDFEMADQSVLIKEYPEHKNIIQQLTKTSPALPIPASITVKRPTQNLVVLTAMDFEGHTLAKGLQLKPFKSDFFNKYGAELFYKKLAGVDVFLVINPGNRNQVNNVGTIAAAQATTLALEHLKPDVIVSAGVAGGYADTGAKIGDVYCAREVMLHGHTIPLESYKKFGQTVYPCTALPEFKHDNSIKYGKLSSGNEFLDKDQKAALPAERRCDIEDMEAGAIAQVLEPFPSVHFLCLKSITNLTGVTNEQELIESSNFEKNLAVATNALVSTLDGLIGSYAQQSAS